MDEAEQLCDRVAIMDHGTVIARGTPRELVASLGVEHVVEFSAAGGRSLTAAAFEGLPGVRDVRASNGEIRLQASELHLVVPALLAELARQGLSLTELRTRSATLEDVFVSLTGRHLRDD
jgi:ABC-2 type transport system ATP-binding protein